MYALDTPLYERLGGEAAIRQAVDFFYRKVLADPELSPFFEGVDMEKQRTMFVMFLSHIFGAPVKYTGHSIRISHAPLVSKGLNDRHFDRFVHHLRETLKELDVTNSDIIRVERIAESLRGDVLCKI